MNDMPLVAQISVCVLLQAAGLIEPTCFCLGDSPFSSRQKLPDLRLPQLCNPLLTIAQFSAIKEVLLLQRHVAI